MTQADSLEASENGDFWRWIRDNPRLAAAVGAALIVVMTLLAYSSAMRADFIWDDDHHVTNNALLRSWDGLGRIWSKILPHPSEYPLPQYYPLTHTTFWLEYHLWGLNPAGYHATNVLLHICNALLVWLILTKLDVPGAWLAGAVFALHPLNVESVAWVAERKNVLSTLFFLMSLYVYLRYAGIIRTAAEAPHGSGVSPGQIQWFSLPEDPQRLYALAAVLFLCALFSKTVASSMPAVALLIMWWKRGRLTPRDIWPTLPLLAVGMGMGMLTAYLEREVVGVSQRPQDWDFASTALGEFGARCIIAGKAIWFYVRTLLWPVGLNFNYAPRWQINPAQVTAYLFPVTAAAVLGVLFVARRRIGRGPVVAALYFVGTLFPALGFIDVWPMRYSFVADHFVYLSSIGMIALLCALIVRCLPPEAVTTFAAVILLLLPGMAFVHSHMFKDAETLWRKTWERSGKTSWMAANNGGRLLLDRGHVAAAEISFFKVIEIKPDHPEARLNLAQVALKRAGAATDRTGGATTKPSDYYEQAINYLQQAIHLQPNYVDAYLRLGQLYVMLEQPDDAERQFEAAVRFRPRTPYAHHMLGKLAMQRDDTDKALQHLMTAVEMDPDSAYIHADFGTVLFQTGNLLDGLSEWNLAMELAPTDPGLPNLFGAKMAASEQYPKAIEYFRMALTIDPKSVEAMNNLGVMAAKTGFMDRAKALFEDTLKIDPNFEKAKQNLAALEAGTLRPTMRPATRSTAPATRP